MNKSRVIVGAKTTDVYMNAATRAIRETGTCQLTASAKYAANALGIVRSLRGLGFSVSGVSLIDETITSKKEGHVGEQFELMSIQFTIIKDALPA